MTTWAGANALIDGALRGPTTVRAEGGVLREVRGWRAGDPPADGLLIPGLVNAHLHLELTHARGKVAGSGDFGAWVGRLFGVERPAAPWFGEGIDELVRAGTAAVCDICNGPTPTEALAAAGLVGVVQRELLGLDPSRQEALLARAAEPFRQVGGVVERSSPHALYSAHPELLRATLAAESGGRPASIHLAEDVSHERFLFDGQGPFRRQLEGLGIDLSTWDPPGCRPLELLEREGWLGPDLLLVHGVRLNPGELARIAHAGATLVVCLRSNLHILDERPPVPEMLAAGVSIALGTDSLASNTDLDVLGEVRALHEAFPDVPMATWLHAATAAGADALRVPVGRLRPDAEPGLLRVHPERPWEEREILVAPGGSHG